MVNGARENKVARAMGRTGAPLMLSSCGGQVPNLVASKIPLGHDPSGAYLQKNLLRIRTKPT